jgi:hypothetical protein
LKSVAFVADSGGCIAIAAPCQALPSPVPIPLAPTPAHGALPLGCTRSRAALHAANVENLTEPALIHSRFAVDSGLARDSFLRFQIPERIPIRAAVREFRNANSLQLRIARPPRPAQYVLVTCELFREVGWTVRFVSAAQFVQVWRTSRRTLSWTKRGAT